jgi:hypothetical protein
VRSPSLLGLRCGREACLPSELERLLLEMVADGFILYCCGPSRVTTANVPAPRHGPADVFTPEVVVWAHEGSPQWGTAGALLDLVPPSCRPCPPRATLAAHPPR